MAYPQGINFRATLVYVTDGANDSFENSNNAVSASYPRTTAQGNTVGWESPGIGNIRDRSTLVDSRLAGINFTTGTQTDFRFDLPAAGSYNVRLAAGDISSVNDTVFSLLDTTTSLGTLSNGTNVAAASFKDATNVVRTAALWPSTNALANFTFSTTICRFRSSGAASVNVIAHAYVESAAPAAPTGTFASTLGNAAMAASGSVVDVGAFASTLGNATMAAIGSVGVLPSGAFASTLAGFTMAATGTLNDSGAFASTLGGVSMAAAGIVAPNVSGTFATTLGDVTMATGGFVGTPPVITGVINRRRLRPRVYPHP